MSAIVGDFSIEVEPGVTLHDHTDVGLAQQWARHALGERWEQLSRGERSQYVAEALGELRRAHED